MSEEQQKNDSFKLGFLTFKAEEITIKYIFDHIRNIAIAAGVFAVGLDVYSGGSLAYKFIPDITLGELIGALMILIGVILMGANATQFVYSSAKKMGLKAISYFIINMIIVLITVDLFIGLAQAGN